MRLHDVPQTGSRTRVLRSQSHQDIRVIPSISTPTQAISNGFLSPFSYHRSCSCSNSGLRWMSSGLLTLLARSPRMLNTVVRILLTVEANYLSKQRFSRLLTHTSRISDGDLRGEDAHSALRLAFHDAIGFSVNSLLYPFRLALTTPNVSYRRKRRS